MAFRVETTETAEQNILGILDWLIEEQAGQAALRWFEGLETAIASLRKCRCVVPPRPRAKSFRLNSASFSMAGRRTSTGLSRSAQTSQRGALEARQAGSMTW
jgi:hypothetical protein